MLLQKLIQPLVAKKAPLINLTHESTIQTALMITSISATNELAEVAWRGLLFFFPGKTARRRWPDMRILLQWYDKYSYAKEVQIVYTGPSQGLKIRGAGSTVVGIICPPGWDRVNCLAKNWGPPSPPAGDGPGNVHNGLLSRMIWISTELSQEQLFFDLCYF